MKIRKYFEKRKMTHLILHECQGTIYSLESSAGKIRFSINHPDDGPCYTYDKANIDIELYKVSKMKNNGAFSKIETEAEIYLL